MALKKTIETVQGVKVENAYNRVENVTILGKDKITFVLRSYVDLTKSFFTEKNYLCDYAIDGDNPIKQAYVYLKFLPEFEGAKDC